MPTILVEDLHKVYGSVAAVDGLSFSVERGSVCARGAEWCRQDHDSGDLGRPSPPGWGSRERACFDPATAGRDYRERIGIVLQEAGVDEDFSVAELLRLYRAMYPRRLDLDQVIGLVGLSDKRNARVRLCPAANAAALTSPLGWWVTPICCSSTSQRLALTRLPGARHGSCGRFARPGQDSAAHDALHGRGTALG